MLGRTISHYLILEELGAGAMGVVYRAEDLRLGRHVAIKFLPPKLARSVEGIERFKREVRVASSLNHPHICTVHDTGDYEGNAFLVMECLDGETVRAMVDRGALPFDEALDIAIDVADALRAAHAGGIIHRDIKPANIFVTAEAGAKVMDFGLAKVVDTSGQIDPNATTAFDIESPATLTSPGAPLGTMAYMSPEQARGQALDARTDIFSFGAVLYEMITGARAFPGTAVAVVFDGILNRDPAPMPTFDLAHLGDLAAIVRRALAKRPADRYPSMDEMLADLRALKRQVDMDQAVSVFSSSSRPRALAGLPVLSRARWRVVALTMGALLCAAIGLWAWTARRTPALTERDSIVLADVANSTGEAVFDDTLRQALAVHLGQSPFLDVVTDERIAETLRTMSRPPDTRLGSDVAREVCTRQGVKAMIEGSIAPIGSHYVLAVTATTCDEGRVLAREQEEATRKEDVLRALSRAASRLRAQIGESLATIEQHDVPIEQATTPSLEALKAYSLGLRQRALGNEIESIPFFQRAIELDPRFALAHTMLSNVFGSLGESARGAEHGRLAFAYREQVTERERLIITYQHYDRVTGELQKSIATLLLWEQAFPRDYRPSNVLSVVYARMGQYERAVDKALEARRRNPDHPFPFSNLAHALRGLNRHDEARKVAEEAATRGIETLPTRRLLYQLAVQRNDMAEAGRHLLVVRGRSREFDMFGAQAQMAIFGGKLHEADQLYALAESGARAAGLTEIADGYIVQAGLMHALLGANDAAVARVRSVLGSRNASVRLAAVQVIGLAGAPPAVLDEAQRVVTATERAFATDTLLMAVSVSQAQAALHLARGDARRALQALDAARPYETGRMALLVPIFMRGLVQLRLGLGADAAQTFARLRELRGVDPFSVCYALAPLGAARAHAMAGDAAKSRSSYELFLSEWQDADGGVPLVEAAQQEFERMKRGAPAAAAQ
jgi:tRNA A-37 threonylcarbamoyl transferase component Bud32